jgi:hypothetical protein
MIGMLILGIKTSRENGLRYLHVIHMVNGIGMFLEVDLKIYIYLKKEQIQNL